MLQTVFLLLLIGQAQGATVAPSPTPVTLNRVSKAKEVLAYSVQSHMRVDKRGGGLETWFPQDVDLNYDFTSNVIELKPGGVAVINYKRPVMTQSTSDSIEGPGSTDRAEVDFNYEVIVSPINEILGEKKLAKSNRLFTKNVRQSATISQNNVIGRFISEVYMLARNLGNFDSSLDFAPKLPVDDVRPGDKWKHTVGYTPQQLEGQSGKTAVQRLDYTYGYAGVVEVDGKKVYRVTADLDMSTNLADFYFQSTGEDPQTSRIHAMPIDLKTHIDFDLDMKTCETLKAVSSSSGGFSVVLSDNTEQPTLEERFKATTTMLLKSRH